MIKKKPARKPIPSNVETAVLAKSARRCALCIRLNSDLTEKLGQIAHLDGDRTNAAEDNLAFMCLSHHSLFDSTTSQHKNYTIPEVKAARAKLYELVARGEHLTHAAAEAGKTIRGATRALLVELRHNAAVLSEMNAFETQKDRYPLDGPNPTQLRRQIWDSQLALVSEILDDDALKISTAYASIAPLTGSTQLRDGSYAKSQAMSGRLAEAGKAFDAAILVATEALSRAT